MSKKNKINEKINLLSHLIFCIIFLTIWEALSRRGFLSPVFFGSPSGIITYLGTEFFITGLLWKQLGYTIFGTLASFLLGSICALIMALFFVIYPKLEYVFEPYLNILNAMPRIALAPLFLLWFGLGIGSKIAVGSSLSFFIVLSSALAGIHSVNSDHLILSRTLGASPKQIFFKLTLPGSVPMLFSGFRLGLIFSMFGVVGSELIAAEHGLGQQLSFLQSMFNMNGVMGLIIILSAIGMILTKAMSILERHILRWQ